jgi:hypothetical protein
MLRDTYLACIVYVTRVLSPDVFLLICLIFFCGLLISALQVCQFFVTHSVHVIMPTSTENVSRRDIYVFANVFGLHLINLYYYCCIAITLSLYWEIYAIALSF